jgi:hypothetical protein
MTKVQFCWCVRRSVAQLQSPHVALKLSCLDQLVRARPPTLALRPQPLFIFCCQPSSLISLHTSPSPIVLAVRRNLICFSPMYCETRHWVHVTKKTKRVRPLDVIARLLTDLTSVAADCSNCRKSEGSLLLSHLWRDSLLEKDLLCTSYYLYCGLIITIL